jgi:hypothetical protein
VGVPWVPGVSAPPWRDPSIDGCGRARLASTAPASVNPYGVPGIGVTTRELICTAVARAQVETWGTRPALEAAVARRLIRPSGLRSALWAPSV